MLDARTSDTLVAQSHSDAKLPLVSVVIPAYNRAKYIRETIESVLAQTWPNVELIVTDDGSTDGTFEILQEYAAQGKLTLLQHPNRENRGQAASANRAIRAAKGQYISPLDSDDLIHPEKLERLVTLLEQNPEAGFAYSNGTLVDHDGREQYPLLPRDHIETGDPNQFLAHFHILLNLGTVIRRSALDTVGILAEQLLAANDQDLLLRLIETAPVLYLPDQLAAYRRHDGAKSFTHNEQCWTESFVVLRRAGSRYPYKPSAIRKRRAAINFRMAQVRWQQRALWSAAIHAVSAGLLDPIRAMRVLSGLETAR